MSEYCFVVFSSNEALLVEVSGVLKDVLGLRQVSLIGKELYPDDDKVDIVIIDEEYFEGIDLAWDNLAGAKKVVLVQESSINDNQTSLTGLDFILIPKINLRRQLLVTVSKLLLNIEWDKINSLTSKTPNVKAKELFVRGEDSMYWRLVLDTVMYIESFGNYIKVHDTDGKWVVRNCSIKNIEDYLPITDFCRVHRSYIVRISKVENFNALNLEIGKRILPLGRSYKTEFERRLIKL